jgi:hypothetical protein
MEVKLQQSLAHKGAAVRKHLGTMFISYGWGDGYAGIKHDTCLPWTRKENMNYSPL